MRAEISELVVQNIKAVTFIPRDLVADSIYLGVVLGACKGFLIFFDGIDPFPSTCAGKGNGITADTCKTINKYCLVSRCGLREVFCYLT